MTDKLKACPFCGSDDVMLDVSGSVDLYWYAVQCGNCEAEGPAKDTEAQAITAWNTRADGWNFNMDEAPNDGTLIGLMRGYRPDDHTGDRIYNDADLIARVPQTAILFVTALVRGSFFRQMAYALKATRMKVSRSALSHGSP